MLLYIAPRFLICEDKDLDPSSPSSLYLSSEAALARLCIFSSCILFSCIQFNVPFKIISLIETSQSIGGAKRDYPGKTT